MKNRYDKILRKYNQKILELCPYNPYLFYVGAFELNKLYKKGERVLEIGCGEGDSALPILDRTQVSLDMLDVSKEMINACKKKLKNYKNRISYIQDDALHYLNDAKPYNFIYSAWTVHNFKQTNKVKLFHAIFENLVPGGAFMLMDKVYMGTDTKQMLERQLKRYHYLPKETENAIVEHEKIDASKEYRMDEISLIDILKKIGFKNIEIKERVERDIVLIAHK